jgi:hypothetical protein
MLPPVERSRVDGIVGRTLERMYTLLTALRKVPILDGVLLENVELVGGSQNIEHGLNRRPRGFIVVADDAGDGIAGNPDNWTDRWLVVTPSSSKTVSLWVF